MSTASPRTTRNQEAAKTRTGTRSTNTGAGPRPLATAPHPPAPSQHTDQSTYCPNGHLVVQDNGQQSDEHGAYPQETSAASAAGYDAAQRIAPATPTQSHPAQSTPVHQHDPAADDAERYGEELSSLEAAVHTPTQSNHGGTIMTPGTGPYISTLPIPPEGGPGGGPPAKSADEMLDSLRAFSRPHGYDLVKRQPSNLRNGEYTRYAIACEAFGMHKSTSKGIRKATSRKIGCEFRGSIKSNKGMDGGWVFQLMDKPETRVHNHGPMARPQRAYYHNGSKDGWHGTVTPGGKYQPEAGRYHLYIGLFCPFAHRVNLVRCVKGLQELLPISIVKPYPKGDDRGWPGWEFAGCRGLSDLYEGATEDNVHGSRYLHDIYFRADKTYTGRYTVPVVWDTKTDTMVANESLEIMRWMSSGFDVLLPFDSPERNLSLYPGHHKAKIDEVKDWLTHDLNSGVYKAGFATSQGAYDRNLAPVFAALNQLELLIYTNGGPFVLGAEMTELDILAYPTIIRFDVIYVQHFKCNLGTIRGDYPVIHEWLKHLYWNVKGFKETTDFRHIKENYTRSHEKINPLGITPLGPFPDIKEGVNLDFLGQLRPGSVDHPAVLEHQKTLPAI
ncbi:hypothetical protein Micbo1qcDRAFT_154968 [Microdochium bolleyi]|uniref:GST N-terminal domain-containing protein n=1 Tax=Microdochium bolleyi TaxID=196109 RepID=A0A136JH34_9PEZI|nr:hypothetical protein Micbo1qcDRAFT_154968 [Microdochium bolleyi]